MDLVGELDKWFSLYTRLRFADWKDDVVCYTCPARGNYKMFDCGHFIRRGVWILRYEPDNARVQCKDCNQYHDGKAQVFEEELRNEIGDERVDELIAMSSQPTPRYDDLWYEEQIIHYKGLAIQLGYRV